MQRMLTFIALSVGLGIIGGLASAALRPSAQHGLLLTVGVEVCGVRLARRVQTPMLGIGRSK